MTSITFGLIMMLLFVAVVHAEYEEHRYRAGEDHNKEDDYYYSEECSEDNNKDYFYNDDYYDSDVEEVFAKYNTKKKNNNKDYIYKKRHHQRKKSKTMPVEENIPRRFKVSPDRARTHVKRVRQDRGKEDFNHKKEYFHSENDKNIHQFIRKKDYNTEDYYYNEEHYHRNNLRTIPRKSTILKEVMVSPSKARSYVKVKRPDCINNDYIYNEEYYEGSESGSRIFEDNTKKDYFNEDYHYNEEYYPRENMKIMPKKENISWRIMVDKVRSHVEKLRQDRNDEGYHNDEEYNYGKNESPVLEGNYQQERFIEDCHYDEGHYPRKKLITIPMEENFQRRIKVSPEKARLHEQQLRKTRGKEGYQYNGGYYDDENESYIHEHNTKKDLFNEDYHNNEGNFPRNKLKTMPMQERFPKKIRATPDKRGSHTEQPRHKRDNEGYYYTEEYYYRINNSEDDSDNDYNAEDYYYDEDYSNGEDDNNGTADSNRHDKNSSEDSDSKDYFHSEEYYDTDFASSIHEDNNKKENSTILNKKLNTQEKENDY